MTPRARALGAALVVAVAVLHGFVLDHLASATGPSLRAATSNALTRPMHAVLLAVPLPAAHADVPISMPMPASPLAEPPAAPAKPLPVLSSHGSSRPRKPLPTPADAQPVAVDAAAAPSTAPQASAAEAAPLQVAAAEPAAPAVAPTAPRADGNDSSNGSNGDGDADTVPVPVYRTRIPGAWHANYKLSRSGITGSGEIDWQPADGGYTLRMEGKVPLFGSLLMQISRGRFDAAGLAPERFTDKRMRRSEQAANFQRAAGKVSFSGSSNEFLLVPGIQDRLSVMVQLGAIAHGWTKPPAVDTDMLIRVIGARGDTSVWALRFKGTETVDTPAGSGPALRFLRESDSAHGTRAEFWLDPARRYMPVKARLTDGNGDALELLRTDSSP